MLLPAAALLALSVGFEMGENMRYKFFLEPMLYVFLLSQLRAVWQTIHDTHLRRQARATEA